MKAYKLLKQKAAKQNIAPKNVATERSCNTYTNIISGWDWKDIKYIHHRKIGEINMITELYQSENVLN